MILTLEEVKKKAKKKLKEKPPGLLDSMKGQPHKEKYLRRTPEKALYYARDILKRRFPEAEKNILKTPYLKKKYAREVLVPHFHKVHKEYGKMMDSDLKAYHVFGDKNAWREMARRNKARKALGEDFKVFIHPKKYLELTTFNKDHEKYIKKEALPHRKYKKLRLSDPFLIIKGNKVVHHDGRHRAAAMLKAGKKSIPILLKTKKLPNELKAQYNSTKVKLSMTEEAPANSVAAGGVQGMDNPGVFKSKMKKIKSILLKRKNPNECP